MQVAERRSRRLSGRRSVDAGLDCHEVEGVERRGASRPLGVVIVRVRLALEVLAGFRDLREQPAPYSQDCADGPFLGR